MQIINWAGAWGLVFMPRLESITVSQSILSLTCDRNKAVLKATFSLPAPRCGSSPCRLRRLQRLHAPGDREGSSSSASLRGTCLAHWACLLASMPWSALPAFPRYFSSHFLLQQERGLQCARCSASETRVRGCSTFTLPIALGGFIYLLLFYIKHV